MAGKKGAPYGNKNALGRGVLRYGATSAFAGTVARIPALTALGGAIVGANKKGSAINDKYIQGSMLSGAVTGGLVGGLGAGPLGAASGATLGAFAQGVSATVGVAAGHYGRKGYDFASSKFKKRKR